MKRPYSVYLLAVVLPSALAIAATAFVATSAWREVRTTSDAQVARMVLVVYEHDLGGPETGDATVARAVVRAVRQVGRTTGYATALYLNGIRQGSTEAPHGPAELSPETLRSLAGEPSGIVIREGSRAGVLVGSEGASPSLSAFATPLTPPEAVLPPPLLLVMGLLLLFATLAGWIQMMGQPQGRAPVGATSLLLLSLVPVLTAGAFLVQTDRIFSLRAKESNQRDLSRGLAVASVRRVTGSPEAVRRLTGFDATLVRDGNVVSSTFAQPVPAVATLRAPPGSFTSSGRVPTPAGASAYVALRVEGDAFLAATSPDPRAHLDAFRMRAGTISLALGAWLLAVGAVVFLGGRRVDSGAETRPLRGTPPTAP